MGFLLAARMCAEAALCGQLDMITHEDSADCLLQHFAHSTLVFHAGIFYNQFVTGSLPQTHCRACCHVVMCLQVAPAFMLTAAPGHCSGTTASACRVSAQVFTDICEAVCRTLLVLCCIWQIVASYQLRWSTAGVDQA